MIELSKNLERTFAQMTIPLENIEQRKEYFIGSSQAVENLLDELYKLGMSKIEGRQLLNYVTTEYAQSKKIALELFNAEIDYQSIGAQELLRKLDLRIGNALMISEKFHQFIYEEIAVLSSREEKTKYILYLIVLGGFLINILIILFGILYIRNAITIPISILRDNVLEVGKGKLNQKIDIKLKKDEIGDLAKAFNKMLDDLKDTQNQLIQAEKMASLGQLSAGVAHEIKNPLTIIIQGIEYLKNSLTDPKLIDATDRIKKAALRADKIVIDLLDYSQPALPKFKKTDIVSLIEETISLIKYQIEIKNIKVTTKYSPGTREINLDSNLMKQVFLNIALNATDALSDNGTISISVDKILEENRDFIQITFSDNGCGIAEENLGKIFDPFFTTKRTRESSGLGLPVTKGIIQRHRGKIDIKSTQNKGTDVIIKMPI
ncbi:MAG: ATP-binding protein [Candidatus Omnitrophica bacterium]|nr:ATP-binding protein [Candidatus Omnitrophota bacterium]